LELEKENGKIVGAIFFYKIKVDQREIKAVWRLWYWW